MFDNVKPWWETGNKPQYATWWEEAAAREKEKKEALRRQQIEDARRAAMNPIVRFLTDLRKVFED